MKKIHPVSLAVLCLALSACGGSGGGGSVASTPAPVPAPAPAPSPTPSPSPTPPPVTLTSSATALTQLNNRAGLVAGAYQPIAITYERAKGSETTQTVGAQTVRLVDPANVKLTANPAAKSYTLEMGLAGFPASKVLDLSKTYNDKGEIIDSNFGNHVVRTDIYSDGTRKVTEYDADQADVGEPVKNVTATTGTLDSYGVNLGLRYVSFGYWTQDGIERIGTATKSSLFFDERQIAFVFGRRTAAGELPANGTATYQGRLSSVFTVAYPDYGNVGPIDLKLTANFATRLIDALMSAKASFGVGDDGWIRGLSANGSGAIGASGGYSIALTGTSFNPDDKVVLPIASTLSGAFFGPGAEETGGVFKIDQEGSTLLFGTYAFARTAP